MKRQRYRRLLIAEDAGAWTVLLQAVMWLPSILYGIAVRARNFCYDRGLFASHKVAVPVVCVGNITTGGTGKTPLVVWLAEVLAEMGLKCAILTRGYRTRKGRLSDEPAILVKSCPDAKVIVSPDRLAGAAKAMNEYNAQVILMDDGYQHRRLRRDLDIVAVDATCPFGGGYMLPAGLLREPVSSLKRAAAVVITRSNQATPVQLHLIEDQVKRANPGAVIARAVHAPVRARVLKGRDIPLVELKGLNVYAFCGIGNPESFFRTLTDLGLKLVATKVYDDHWDYTTSEVREICRQARLHSARMILTTRKDWIKTALAASQEGSQAIPFAWLDIKLEITEGEDKIIDLVARAVRHRP